jgi:hypothetical protein
MTKTSKRTTKTMKTSRRAKVLGPAAAPPPAVGNLNCSFCGASQKKVRKLIAEPTVYICDGCVGVASDIITAEHAAKEAGTPLFKTHQTGTTIETPNGGGIVSIGTCEAEWPRDARVSLAIARGDQQIEIELGQVGARAALAALRGAVGVNWPRLSRHP